MAFPLPPRAIASLRLHLIFLLAMAAARTRVTIAAAPAPDRAASVFLRSCCASTLYPDVCYDSLLPYASSFQTSHVRLARAAADVAAADLRAFSARVKDLLHRGSGGAADAALRDCASTVSAAASLARQSSAELTRLVADGSTSAAATSAGGGSRQARWEVSNAKTWLSAAMTDEGTCAQGFADADEAATASPAGKVVAAGVASVRRYTSNALALVNAIPL